MIKIEIDVGSVDYDRLVDEFLPVMIEKLKQSNNPAAALLSGGLPLPMAKAILKKLPEHTKEQLVSELLNANRESIMKLFEETAEKSGFRLKISDIKARTSQP